MTTATFKAWLSSNDRVPVTLIDVTPNTSAGVAHPIFLSDYAYTGGLPGATPIIYDSRVSGGLDFSGEISLDGQPSVSYGDIEVDNSDGALDSWLDLVWHKCPIKVLVGDARWPLSSFSQVFQGVSGGVESRSLTTINISVMDALQRANVGMTSTRVGGTLENRDETLPVAFGEVFNLTPQLVVPSDLVYAVNFRAVKRIIQVRDNGVPVEFSDVGGGRFKLLASPAGEITASVSGDLSEGVYTHRAGEIALRLLTEFSPPSSRFLLSELDTQSFDAIDQAKPYPIGVYVKERSNLLALCQEVLSSVRASLVCRGDGVLKVTTLEPNPAMIASTITKDDIVQDSLAVDQVHDVVSSVPLDYCKNWTVQSSGLASSLPTELVDSLKREWWTVKATSASAASLYGTAQDPQHQQTFLVRQEDASAEAWHRLETWSRVRKTFKVDLLGSGLLIDLGDTVILQHPRYGLAVGVAGVVVKISRSWVGGKTTVWILV